MKKVTAAILSVIMIAMCFAGCNGNGAEQNKSGKLKVVAVTFPIYDWVRNITGDSADVILMNSNGTDMHSFEPTATDIVSLSTADVFVYIGGVSDKWVDNAVASGNNEDLVCVKLIDTVNALEEETVEGMQGEDEEDEEGEELDEHIWLSPLNAVKAVEKIEKTLCDADPDNASVYEKNSLDYKAKLETLDKQYSETVSKAARKTLLFSDRFPFRYLTEAYGLSYYAAFMGCSAETEASFETVTFLIEKTKELNLPCIIKLDGSDGKIADTVSEQTGAKVISLNSMQSVTDKDIKDGITYLSVMESNLAVLAEALS